MLKSARSIDIDFDIISHAVILSAFWGSQEWDLNISNKGAYDRVEVGILSNETPLEPEELSLAGALTIIGEDSKPSATLFSFPARHHSHFSTFSSSFLMPTGLHPTLQLQISDSIPPPQGDSCTLHAHLTLPRTIFADKYQLSDPIFLSSQNLSSIHHITKPVDLEAPSYTLTQWGSSILLSLSPPLSSQHQDPWTASVPFHLRYDRPTTTGYSNLEVPYPILFWACVADEGSKFPINPFDRVNLGYDGLFGPKTMFYHLNPVASNSSNGKVDGRLLNTVEIPVLGSGKSGWVELGTAATIILGFAWVMWRLVKVWMMVGYGSSKVNREAEVKKKQ